MSRNEDILQAIVNGESLENCRPQSRMEKLLKQLGEKSPSSGSSIPGGGIIDVEELPSKWSGTPVPNTGYIEKVYLNTNLTAEEVKSRMDRLSPNEALSYLAVVVDDNNCIVLRKESNGDGGYAYEIIMFKNGSSISIFANEWSINNKKDIIEINANVVDKYAGSFVVGSGNDLISDLISITPFVINDKDIDSQSIYRVLKSGDIAGGTPIPNSGTIKTADLVLNYNLSIEETVAHFEQLELVDIPIGAELPGDKVYFPLCIGMGEESAPALMIIYNTVNNSWIVFSALGDVLFASMDVPELGISAGWNKELCKSVAAFLLSYLGPILTIIPVETDFTDITGISGVTYQNDKLNKVVFIAPYIYENAVYDFFIFKESWQKLITTDALDPETINTKVAEIDKKVEDTDELVRSMCGDLQNDINQIVSGQFRYTMDKPFDEANLTFSDELNYFYNIVSPSIGSLEERIVDFNGEVESIIFNFNENVWNIGKNIRLPVFTSVRNGIGESNYEFDVYLGWYCGDNPPMAHLTIGLHFDTKLITLYRATSFPSDMFETLKTAKSITFVIA